MAGYPIQWDDKWEAQDATSAGSPYSADEIGAYLRSCHRQYGLDESEFSVREIRLIKTKSLTTRRFWLWEVTDNERVQWFVVVGCGSGPFSDQHLNRWLYAQTNDEDLSAAEFLDNEIAQHP